VLRRLMGVAAVTVAAGVAVAGCAPIKMGAAAIVGNNSVSIAQLDSEVGLLATAQKEHPPAQNSLTQQQITQATLTWLIRFQISDQLASQNGISVNADQEQQALQALIKLPQENAEEEGQSASSVTVESIMITAGIPPNLQPQLEKYLVVEDTYVTAANGGTAPNSQSEETAVEDKYNHATCVAAKSLNIQVNPQFGRLSYTSSPTVIDSANTVSLPSGTSPSSSPGGLSPAC
jgi:hypothetical protein